tara:strand:- start:319 stop:1674 length:1356 start_codon:yes stop_codon:yes gene_type:complete
MKRLSSGWLMIVLGLIFNKWFIALLFSKDGVIESGTIIIIIITFNVLCILCGFLIIFKVIKPISRNIIFGVFSTLIVLVILETGLQTISFLKTIVDDVRQNKNNIIKQKTDLSSYKDYAWAHEFWEEYKTTYNRPRAVIYKPYVGWSRSKFSGEYINIDSDGNRETWFPINKKLSDSIPIIYFFGGSTIWGTGARDEYTIPSILSKNLYEKNNIHKVYNYGESAFSITQNLIHLILLLQENRIPDKVIFYNGVNIVHTTYDNGDPRISSVHESFGESIDKAKYTKTITDHIRIAIYKLIFEKSLVVKNFSKLINRSDQSISQSKVGSRYDDDQLINYKNKIIECYLASIDMISHLADKYDFEYYMFWQPVLFTENKIYEEEKKLDEHYYDKELARLFRLCNDHMKSINKHNFYNLSDVFHNRNKIYYIDFAHLNEAGNLNVADRIFKIINK